MISGFKVAIEIFAAQSEFNPTPGSTVQGNKIGTDLTGEVALGNDVGIYINGVPRNLIGGTAPGAGNVISGNTIGIYLLGSTTTANQIQGNLIGLDAAGKVPLGNYIGVYLDAATANTDRRHDPGRPQLHRGRQAQWRRRLDRRLPLRQGPEQPDPEQQHRHHRRAAVPARAWGWATTECSSSTPRTTTSSGRARRRTRSWAAASPPSASSPAARPRPVRRLRHPDRLPGTAAHHVPARAEVEIPRAAVSR